MREYETRVAEAVRIIKLHAIEVGPMVTSHDSYRRFVQGRWLNGDDLIQLAKSLDPSARFL